MQRAEAHESNRTPAGALVSVIIPCYNQAHYLSEAIESVLNQTYPHFEIVVIDDGSPDNTSEVAARYEGVRCIRQQNKGLPGARNTGITESKGEFLIFLDADDRLLPEAMEAGLRALQAYPECAFASGHYLMIDADGSPLQTPHVPCIEGEHYLALLRDNYVTVPAAVMYRRSALDVVGGFDPSLKSSEDYDMYLRIARRFPVLCHDKVIVEYRQHSASMSRNMPRMLKAVLTVLGAQKPYVKGDPRREEAYRKGRAFWEERYGEPIIEDIRACVGLAGEERKGARNFKQAARGAFTLLRYCPSMFLRRARKMFGIIFFRTARR